MWENLCFRSFNSEFFLSYCPKRLLFRHHHFVSFFSLENDYSSLLARFNSFPHYSSFLPRFFHVPNPYCLLYLNSFIFYHLIIFFSNFRIIHHFCCMFYSFLLRVTYRHTYMYQINNIVFSSLLNFSYKWTNLSYLTFFNQSYS